MKDVTHTPLFECIMSGEIESSYYDLHNDYQCIKMQLDPTQKILQLRFTNDDFKIIVEFHQATITSFTFILKKHRITAPLISSIAEDLNSTTTCMKLQRKANTITTYPSWEVILLSCLPSA